MRRLLFSLKMVLGCVLLVAAMMAGFAWWQWWTTTRHMRALTDAVAESALDPETKRILRKLAWESSAWESGLIRSLSGPISMKQLAWRGKTKGGQEAHEIYIFDAFVRPVADTPIPPVCVVLEKHGNLSVWATVATYSSGFLNATLDDKNILTITTVSNWFYGKGTYRYALREKSITPLDEGVFAKFEKK